MPGSSTTPDRPSACVGALEHIAFRYTDSVGTRNQFSIAAQWLACTFPYRRFADILADACARLGADVVCYSFIVVDLHHLLLAGLPAHPCENANTLNRDRSSYSFKVVLAAHMASPFNFEVELKNIILAALPVFEFSHRLGPSRRNAPPHKLDRSQGKADIADAALNMWLMSTGEALAFLAVVAALTALALAA